MNPRSGLRPAVIRFVAAFLLVAHLGLHPALAAARPAYHPIHLEGEIASRPGHVHPGSTVTFGPGFWVGDPAPTGTYQWFRNGAPIAGATTTSLVLTNVTAAANGVYEFTVTREGVVEHSDPLTLNVTTPPPSPIDPAFATNFPADFSFSDRPQFFAGANDGSVIVQDYAYVSTLSGYVYRAIRLNANGTIDPTLSYARADNPVLAVLPDGSLITQGSPFRFNRDGSPAPFTLPPTFGVGQLAAAVVQPDGKFLIAQNYPVRVARLNVDGSLDSSFVFTATFGAPRVDHLRIDRQGRVLVHGQGDAQGFYFLLARLTPDGSADPSFNPVRNVSDAVPLDRGGIVVTNYENSYDASFGLLNDDGTRVAGYITEAPVPWLPTSRMVSPAGWLFAFNYDGLLRRYKIGPDRLSFDPTFYPGPAAISGMGLLADGNLLVLPSRPLPANTPPVLLRLRATEQVPPYAPVVALTATRNDYSIYNSGPHGIQGTMPALGESVRIDSVVYGIGPLTYQWLALDGQTLPADTTLPSLTFPAASPANFGRFQLRVTSPGGTTWSDPVFLSLPLQQPYLANLSGRAVAGTGEDTIIAGLVISDPGTTLLRGAGPALKDLGVTNYLPNPAINLFNSTGALIGNNDNWGSLGNGDEITKFAANAGAFAFRPGSLDAAGLPLFKPGAYTVHLFDQAGGSGVGLVEVYTNVTPASNASADYLLNLSFRARTGPGEATAIAGFVLSDPQGYGRSAKVLLRAVGPTLLTKGVLFPLENPVLTLYNAKGELVAQNDDWSHAPASNPTAPAELTATMKQVGAFDLPANSHDAALLLDLPAGAYTMHATGGTGVVLLEIYLVR